MPTENINTRHADILQDDDSFRRWATEQLSRRQPSPERPRLPLFPDAHSLRIISESPDGHLKLTDGHTTIWTTRHQALSHYGPDSPFRAIYENWRLTHGPRQPESPTPPPSPEPRPRSPNRRDPHEMVAAYGHDPFFRDLVKNRPDYAEALADYDRQQAELARQATDASLEAAAAPPTPPEKPATPPRPDRAPRAPEFALGSTAEFLRALSRRESGGDIGVINAWGYIGKWQFGTTALMDAGVFTPTDAKHLYYPKTIRQRGKVKTIKAWTWDGRWNAKVFADAGIPGITSREAFLRSEAAQDYAFLQHKKAQWRQLRARGAEKYLGRRIAGIDITPAALLAGAHLLGPGGVMDFLRRGRVRADGNGVPITDYMRQFSHYDVSSLIA